MALSVAVQGFDRGPRGLVLRCGPSPSAREDLCRFPVTASRLGSRVGGTFA